jgi:penicillin-binding protein 2
MKIGKYRIKRTEYEELRPEETLADSISDFSIMESPIGRRVFSFLYIFVIIAVLFLIGKAFQLQILEGRSLANIVQKNSSPRYSAPSLRGIIYDTNSIPLVENVPSFDLVALHSDLPSQEQLDSEISTLSPIINISVADISAIFKDKENEAFFFIKKDLTKEEVTKINLLKSKGIFVLANSSRYYPMENILSSLIGYTAKVSPNDLETDDYYLPTDRIGRLGLEQFYENDLRGEHRDIFLKSINYGSPGLAMTSQPGNDLYLNIDSEMQKKLYHIMTNTLSPLGLFRAAAVVQDVRTGAVLSLVSLPVFDPNAFENQTAQSTALISDILEDKNKPLFNRVISGRYSSGSTIKPLLALAGLKEKIVTPETTIDAQGSITVYSKYDPSVSWTFRDWKVHGITNLRKAIENSVDVYFYALGGGYGNIRGLGEEKIISYYRQMLMDQELGIDLPGEITGFVPDEDWKLQTKGTEWFVGDTYNISIGQGDMGVTPLWLNTYIGSIANGGNIMKPYIVKEIKDADGNTIRKFEPEIIKTIPFSDDEMQVVKEGLRMVCTTGSAKMLKDLPVAGKTGTAQLSSGFTNLNSLFVSYGPYENPEIVMTVLVENVQRETYLSVQISKQFYEWYLTR